MREGGGRRERKEGGQRREEVGGNSREEREGRREEGHDRPWILPKGMERERQTRRQGRENGGKAER
jgi:hypothetical protein